LGQKKGLFILPHPHESVSVEGVRGKARNDSMGSGWGSLRIDKASD
jgi:hypothetical protein